MLVVDTVGIALLHFKLLLGGRQLSHSFDFHDLVALHEWFIDEALVLRLEQAHRSMVVACGGTTALIP